MGDHSDIDHTGITGVSSGNVATDSIFDAKGDLPAGTGANTAQKLPVGANDTMLMAASGETTGLKWWPKPKLVRKTSDESVTNNTLQDDDTLVLPIAASEVWAIDYTLFCDGLEAADIKFGLTVPAGATFTFAGIGLSQALAAGATQGDARMVGATSGSLGFGVINAGTIVPVLLRALVVNGGNAGNVTLQWAQVNTNATASKVLANSHLIAHRVA